jgi:hypothetical protein
MTDFDYGLANRPSASLPAGVIVSSCGFGRRRPRSRTASLPLLSRTCGRRGENRAGRSFVRSDKANSAIYQSTSCAPGRDWCGLSTRKPPLLSWHGRRRTALSLPMTGRSFRPRPHFSEKQRLIGKIANEVLPWALSSGASGTSGSDLATPATEAGDQHLVTQDAIAAAPTAERVTVSCIPEASAVTREGPLRFG